MSNFLQVYDFVLFVWFDSLRPINNLSVKQGWIFLGWTSTKLEKMCLAQGPQHSDAGEARTRKQVYEWLYLQFWDNRSGLADHGSEKKKQI